MTFSFSYENLEKIETLKKRYPNPASLSLPCLWMAQYQEGYISLEVIDEISRLIGTPSMEIYRLVSFYTMFHSEPQEKLNVQVCKTLSCKLCGSDEILKHLQEKEDINIIHVECLGSCGTAPVMQIDDVNYEKLTPKKIDTLLKELK